MPYRFSDNYETEEDIEREYRDPYRHPMFSPVDVGKERRLHAARMRRKELEEMELRDQMKARVVNLNVDLRNKYQIKQAINILTTALEAAENEVYKIPIATYDEGRIKD